MNVGKSIMIHHEMEKVRLDLLRTVCELNCIFCQKLAILWKERQEYEWTSFYEAKLNSNEANNEV